MVVLFFELFQFLNHWSIIFILICNLVDHKVELLEANDDHLVTGHPDEHQAPEGRLNDQGAGATTVRKIATALVLIESWKGSVIGRGKRGRAETGIGTEGTGKDAGPAAQTGTKTGENVEEVTAAAGTEGVNAKIKKETVGMTGAGGRTGITIKIEALRGRGPRIRRAGERLMTGGTKMTGRGTEKRGRPKG